MSSHVYLGAPMRLVRGLLVDIQGPGGSPRFGYRVARGYGEQLALPAGRARRTRRFGGAKSLFDILTWRCAEALHSAVIVVQLCSLVGPLDQERVCRL